MTRQAHLDWCKQRALHYARAGDVKNACASMGSDLDKHPETKDHPGARIGFVLLLSGCMSQADCIRWIEGFQ